MILAYTCFAGWLVLYRLRSQAIRRRVRTLQRQREQAARAREEAVS